MSSYSFLMAQQIIPAAQLVPKFQRITRCNNYDVLQSIPCSLECKINGQIFLDHPLSYALTATADIPAVYLLQFWKKVRKVPDIEDTIIFKVDSQEINYTVNMFRNTLQLSVETLDNPFVSPINIEIIESFMHTVGCQGVVDKVSAFYMKFLAQPWQTMFKVFNRCLNTRTSRHDQIKINILQLFHAVVNQTNVDYASLLWWDFMNCVSQKKDVIQYPRFTKFIIADIMKKFPSIPPRLEEDYHSIKDDILLASVYTTRNVTVRGMLIPDALLTDEIRATDDYKEYEMVFVNVVVLMNQPQPKVVKGNKDVESYADKFDASMIHDDVDDFGDRTEPRSHKEHTEVVDDDDNKEEKKDEKEGDEMGRILAQELRLLRSLIHATTSKITQAKTHFSAKFSHLQERFATMDVQPSERYTFQAEVPALISKEFNAQAPQIIEELFKNYMKSNVQDQANDPALWDVLKRKFEKSSTSNTSYRDDEFHSQRHDDHQEDVAPPEGEKREWDAWEEEIVIDEDEVILEDETPELITEFQNVDKCVPTIFDHARMKASLNDILSNQFRNAKEYAYHLEPATSFMENQIVWESRKEDIQRSVPKPLIFYEQKRNPK
ncbi:hypothetical protein Tco_0854840 [Tanacetum coccineum]